MCSKLIGPFSQIVTMDKLPETGPLADGQLEVIANGGIVVDEGGMIEAVGDFDELRTPGIVVKEVQHPAVAIPGLIDAHTHICFAGDRSGDYAARLQGLSYQQIAAQGGGILDTVAKTRAASEEELTEGLLKRLAFMRLHGVTSCEVKTGYGLSVEAELKMLRAIGQAMRSTPMRIVPTCLAAHALPKEIGDPDRYLDLIIRELLPQAKAYCNRVDIFVEDGAFTAGQAVNYLNMAKKMGFEGVVHADQFSAGGSSAAAQAGAVSADHLEISGDKELELLKRAGVAAIALPGASMGLGVRFAPARKILDMGLALAIASDWNPGSAPMGLLLLQAAVLGMYQKLSAAETLAAVTIRAARALHLGDGGVLRRGARADIAVFPCEKYQKILYYQGAMNPTDTYIAGCCSIHQGNQ